MTKVSSKPIRFVALIPHRDALFGIEAYKRQLFEAGVIGAYSFPAVAPLGAFSRPLSLEELKTLAVFLREASRNKDKPGTFIPGEPRVLRYASGTTVLRLFGPELAGPAISLDAPGVWFPSTVLGAGLLPDFAENLPPPPPCFFRAAMLANMVLRPLKSGAEGYSFEWKFGAKVWLPKFRG
ncbi:MAG: hypothetical protein LBG90_02440 [Spirochaetaceae bacterium]|jgi:hypothetical protein|nr:hypothetical protein [Spirochaetaceae bacterium]